MKKRVKLILWSSGVLAVISYALFIFSLWPRLCPRLAGLAEGKRVVGSDGI